jgi:hypothetical protein
MSDLFPRCSWTPQVGDQVSGRIDGHERLCWHAAPTLPRPCFFPLIGPRGKPLTRMGHPGAPDHDHHCSIWFAHHQVLGINFWANGQPAQIRQQRWLAYQDGDDEAILAVQLGWFDGHDPQPLIVQELLAALRPGEFGETLIELQSQFTPLADRLELGKTNFGLLAVRVAKSLSVVFGGGQITDADGRTGEAAIFGQSSSWVDYSGPVMPNVVEGITFFDHPGNPRYPTHWHVRDDGWMGASFCYAEPWELRKDQPLTLRYLLHAHRGAADASRINVVAAEFANRPELKLVARPKPHTQFGIVRA